MSTSGFQSTAAARPHDARVAPVLWQGLVVGVLAALCWAAWSGPEACMQAGGAWLVLAPAASLLAWYRHELVAAWQGILVATPGRRAPRPQSRQARRLRTRSPRPAPVRQAA